MFDDADAKLRMSRTTKPRKLALLPGAAPWPTREMIGPWWDGSLLGLAESKAMPGVGIVRRLGSLAVPSQDVSAVATRSWKVLRLSRQGNTTPTVGPGALTKCRTAIGNISPLV